MKSIANLSCALVCFAFAACSHQSGKSSQTLKEGAIYINLDHTEPLSASVLFDTIEYVPLETSDSFLVSGMNHLKLNADGDIYFVSDKSFFLFDGRTGKGKLKISKLGSGPGEYTSLFDSHFDADTRQIELLDNNGKRIMVYDSAGNYLCSISLPFMPFMLTKTESSGYWFYNNNLLSDVSESKVVHYDVGAKKIVEEYAPIDKHLAGYFFVEDEKNLVACGEDLLYLSSPVDTIYRIAPGKGMEPAYVLDFGKYKAPSSFYASDYQDIMAFVEAAMKNDYVFELPVLAVNDDWLAVGCVKAGQLSLTFHSIDGEKTLTSSSLLDDFHFETSLTLKTKNMHFCMDNDYFYFTMTAEQLLELQGEGKQGGSMYELIENKEITDSSNPILVKCRLKRN